MAENDTAVERDGTANDEQQPAAGDAAVGADATYEELQQALAAVAARAEDNWARHLREAAELENVRKRAARDLERARKFSLEPVLSELLPVRDSLEMGLAAADSQTETSVEALREGTAMTLKLLEQVMSKFGVEVVEPDGEPFDPTLHEAMVTQPSDGPPDTVIEVVQKGYQLNGRLLRPARVVVSRAPD